jgi:hypothetical protein
MTKADALRKIHALQARACDGATPSEAAACAQKAAELRIKYGITSEELRGAGSGSGLSPSQGSRSDPQGRPPHKGRASGPGSRPSGAGGASSRRPPFPGTGYPGDFPTVFQKMVDATFDQIKRDLLRRLKF